MFSGEITMSTTMEIGFVNSLAGSGALRDLASSVISLLQNATKEVERDREAAKIFIAKASSLLQVEVARGGVPDLDIRSGGLPPWKIRRLKDYVEEHLSQP